MRMPLIYSMWLISRSNKKSLFLFGLSLERKISSIWVIFGKRRKKISSILVISGKKKHYSIYMGYLWGKKFNSIMVIFGEKKLINKKIYLVYLWKRKQETSILSGLSILFRLSLEQNKKISSILVFSGFSLFYLGYLWKKKTKKSLLY